MFRQPSGCRGDLSLISSLQVVLQVNELIKLSNLD